MLTAITRAVSRAINRCELTFLDRQPIDIARAQQEHHAYESLLTELGANVISLPPEPEFPDSVFVEDPAIVLDEVAVINRMGVASRQGETESIARALEPYRLLYRMLEPGTLEGGDVLRMGRRLFVGLSPRTNADGIEQLSDVLRQFDYTVHAVELRGCMHLKSGCTALDDRTILANREWIDASSFQGFEIIDVVEPHAANVLQVGETVVIPAQFPKTQEALGRRGYRIRTLDISELMKAESGLTCSSLLFEA